MRVLITGASGQLGRALLQHPPIQLAGESVEIMATSRNGGSDSIALDLADAAACRSLVYEFQPDWLVNAGAYTAVDQAESEPELTHAVNAAAPAAFAEALQPGSGRLLQLSTDFVFNGRQGTPYLTSQPFDPLCVYGASKAAGEAAVAANLDQDRFCILRTSWVYGPVGQNFLLTMLRLLSERDQLGVVADQVGCPTSTQGLAKACWSVLAREVTATHHWTDAGVASWYDFAVAIAEFGHHVGLLTHPARIHPITTGEFPTAARRPSYSVLDCSETRQLLNLDPTHWRTSLREAIDQLD